MKVKRELRQWGSISPLLFVIMMEYLHRTLQKLEKVHAFNFHSKREKLHIINLSFIDDLLIFNQKINAICRSFLLTGGDTVTRKSQVTWDQVCSPRTQGGMNLISLDEWNRANMSKLLWNLGGKADSLLIKWIHSYYIKKEWLMIM